MQLVEEIVKNVGAGGFGKKDESENLDDMTYAEKFVFSDEVLNALKNLKVAETVGRIIKGGAIILMQDDILPLRNDSKEIGMNGICHKLNQVFVAGRLPFFATSMASENAVKKELVKTRGDHKGESYKITVSDRVRIYRISRNFNLNNYAADGSDSIAKSKKGTIYHEPTIGMVLRTEKNISGRELTF